MLIASLSSFLSIVGPGINLVFFASTGFSGYSILVEKSVKNLSIVPFLALLTNCSVWSIYGTLIADYSVLVPNCIGALIALFCVIAFSMYSKVSSQRLYIVSSAILVMTIHFAVYYDSESVGFVACILSVLLTAAPLATITTVLKDGNTNSLPSFTTNLAMSLSALVWSLYGLLVAMDPMIYVPNMLGCIISILLLILYGIYPNNSVSNKHFPVNTV